MPVPEYQNIMFDKFDFIYKLQNEIEKLNTYIPSLETEFLDRIENKLKYTNTIILGNSGSYSLRLSSTGIGLRHQYYSKSDLVKLRTLEAINGHSSISDESTELILKEAENNFKNYSKGIKNNDLKILLANYLIFINKNREFFKITRIINQTIDIEKRNYEFVIMNGDRKDKTTLDSYDLQNGRIEVNRYLEGKSSIRIDKFEEFYLIDQYYDDIVNLLQETKQKIIKERKKLEAKEQKAKEDLQKLKEGVSYILIKKLI